MNKNAFTLAETLTTLVVIGIISVIVLPTLKTSVDSKALESQKKTFLTKFNGGLHRMQIKSELSRTYDSTEDFVESMKNHFNITKTCPQNKLQDCFGEKLKDGTKKYDLSNIRNSADINIHFDENVNVNGLVFSDGTRALIAYNPDCSIGNIYDTSIDVTQCIAMYYDVNGFQGRTLVDEDVFTINTGEKDFEIIDAFIPTKAIKGQCEAVKAKYNIQYCENASDSWVGALIDCERKGGELPSSQQMLTLAKKIYGTDAIGLSGTSSNLPSGAENELYKQIKASGKYAFWTREEYSANGSYYSKFESTSYTGMAVEKGNNGAYTRAMGNGVGAICIKKK